MMIDIHTHIWPDALAPRALDLLSARAGLTPATDGTAAGTEKVLRSHGIDHAVIQNIATKPKQVEILTDFAAAHNTGFWRAFASIHPDYENWHDELYRVKELGIPGIKFHPDYQDFFVDEAKTEKIYALADKLGLTVLFHGGVDIGVPGEVHFTPERFSHVAPIFTKGRVICAHMGSHAMPDEVLKFLPQLNCYIDTSFAIALISRALFHEIYRALGADRILFGTDTPWSDIGLSIHRINEWVVNEDDRHKLFSQNALKLIGTQP